MTILSTVLKSIRRRLFEDRLWNAVFIIILLKCMVFAGFVISKSHLSIDFIKTIKAVFFRLPFYFAFLSIIPAFLLLLKNRVRLWAMIAFNLVVSILLLIDIWYLRSYNAVPSVYSFQPTGNNSTVITDSLPYMLHWSDPVFIIDILVLIVIAILMGKALCKKTGRNIPMFFAVLSLSLLIIAYIPLKTAFSGADITGRIINPLDSKATAVNISPVGYHIANIISYFEYKKPVNLTEGNNKEIEDWFSGKKESVPDNKYKALLKGKNLIFIQVESLENFVINQSVDGQEITPNLNKLLKNGLYFSNVREQVNQGVSSDSDLLANTSIYPVRQGSSFFSFPNNTYNSLPKLLENLGYGTLAIHPDEGYFWNWAQALTSMGFDRCIDATHFKIDEVINFGISDGSYLRQVADIIRKQKQPFYSLIVTMSSHAPFNIPKKHRMLKLDDSLEKSVLGGYLQSVHYTDKHIGLFLDSLKSSEFLENTVVVVYGDHGGVHKFYPGYVDLVKPSQEWWLENNGEIPFIIYQSGLEGKEIKTTGGQIDIMPTVCYLMGVPEESLSKSAMGRNLLKTSKDFAVLQNGEFVGTGDRQHAVKGLDVADMIIRGNYFKGDNK